ncbi:MAG: FHA domain-containing protein [Janthinobacterium lividum]
MSLYRGLFFATVAGMAGGLVASLIASLLNVPLADVGMHTLPDTVTFLIFGMVVSVAMYLHFDKVLLGRLRGSSVGYGLLFGGAAALVAAGLNFLLAKGVAGTSPTLYRIATWALCFSIVGLGLGARWARTNLARVLHTYAGGLVGGLLGGLVFVLFTPHLPAGVAMCGLMLAGAGTGFGAGIAPVLVKEGLLRFVSSGDARAQNKLGKNKTLWDLDVEESYTLGSAQTAQSGSKFQQGADICIPDSSVAPRHAVVFSKDGRYFIARHPDAGGPDGIAKYVLRVKGKTVVSSQELQPSDDVLIGRTALRFDSRKLGE